MLGLGGTLEALRDEANLRLRLLSALLRLSVQRMGVQAWSVPADYQEPRKRIRSIQMCSAMAYSVIACVLRSAAA